MTRLLITGASGQLARRAAELVLGSGAPERLILVSRNPAALAGFAARGVEVRRGDFAVPASLPGAFAGADRMLLVSTTDLDHRIEQHTAAIDAAVAAGVGHVIYTSGLAPAPPNPAVVMPSHYATERKLAASPLDWTVLRNSLYAEYQAAEAEQAIADGRLVHNRGAGSVAYVAREDCAAAAAAVLTGAGHRNTVYDITGPEGWTADQLAALYSELGGVPVEPVALDDEAFVSSLVGAATGDDHLRYGAELVASFGRSVREGFMASRTDHVEQLTGRAPQTLRAVLRAARG